MVKCHRGVNRLRATVLSSPGMFLCVPTDGPFCESCTVLYRGRGSYAPSPRVLALQLLDSPSYHLASSFRVPSGPDAVFSPLTCLQVSRCQDSENESSDQKPPHRLQILICASKPFGKL
jgi:hypothetical protein